MAASDDLDTTFCSQLEQDFVRFGSQKPIPEDSRYLHPVASPNRITVIDSQDSETYGRSDPQTRANQSSLLVYPDRVAYNLTSGVDSQDFLVYGPSESRVQMRQTGSLVNLADVASQNRIRKIGQPSQSGFPNQRKQSGPLGPFAPVNLKSPIIEIDSQDSTNYDPNGSQTPAKQSSLVYPDQDSQDFLMYGPSAPQTQLKQTGLSMNLRPITSKNSIREVGHYRHSDFQNQMKLKGPWAPFAPGGHKDLIIEIDSHDYPIYDSSSPQIEAQQSSSLVYPGQDFQDLLMYGSREPAQMKQTGSSINLRSMTSKNSICEVGHHGQSGFQNQGKQSGPLAPYVSGGPKDLIIEIDSQDSPIYDPSGPQTEAKQSSSLVYPSQDSQDFLTYGPSCSRTQTTQTGSLTNLGSVAFQNRISKIAPHGSSELQNQKKQSSHVGSKKPFMEIDSEDSPMYVPNGPQAQGKQSSSLVFSAHDASLNSMNEIYSQNFLTYGQSNTPTQLDQNSSLLCLGPSVCRNPISNIHSRGSQTYDPSGSRTQMSESSSLVYLGAASRNPIIEIDSQDSRMYDSSGPRTQLKFQDSAMAPTASQVGASWIQTANSSARAAKSTGQARITAAQVAKTVTQAAETSAPATKTPVQPTKPAVQAVTTLAQAAKISGQDPETPGLTSKSSAQARQAFAHIRETFVKIGETFAQTRQTSAQTGQTSAQTRQTSAQTRRTSAQTTRTSTQTTGTSTRAIRASTQVTQCSAQDTKTLDQGAGTSAQTTQASTQCTEAPSQAKKTRRISKPNSNNLPPSHTAELVNCQITKTQPRLNRGGQKIRKRSFQQETSSIAKRRSSRLSAAIASSNPIQNEDFSEEPTLVEQQEIPLLAYSTPKKKPLRFRAELNQEELDQRLSHAVKETDDFKKRFVEQLTNRKEQLKAQQHPSASNSTGQDDFTLSETEMLQNMAVLQQISKEHMKKLDWKRFFDDQFMF